MIAHLQGGRLRQAKVFVEGKRSVALRLPLRARDEDSVVGTRLEEIRLRSIVDQPLEVFEDVASQILLLGVVQIRTVRVEVAEKNERGLRRELVDHRA